jgi:DNA-directed RNA polymerase subunit beta'
LATWSRENHAGKSGCGYRKIQSTVIESKTGEERPRISIKADDGKTAKLPTGSGMARYMLPVEAIFWWRRGTR